MWAFVGAGVRGPVLQLTAFQMHRAIQPRWQQTAGNKSQAASASAFETTEMSSLVALRSKYFGHLDATFCACEIKCIINLVWPGDKVGRSDGCLGSGTREGEHVLTRSAETQDAS